VTPERRAFALALLAAFIADGFAPAVARWLVEQQMQPPTQSVPDRTAPQWHQLPAQPFPLDPGEPWEP
jgi:hypothetical protein